MFGMGMNEVMIVLVIAVIVIGPKQLPNVARAMGKMVAQFKRATNDLRNTVSDEVNEHVPMDEIREIRDTLQTGVSDLQDQSRSLVNDEFGDDKKIGAELANELTAAYSEIPTEADFGSGNGGDPQPRKRRLAKGEKKTRAAAASGKTPAKKTASARRSGKSNGMAKGASAKAANVNTAAKTAATTAGKGAAKSRQGSRA